MDRSKLLAEEKIGKLLLRFSLPAIVGMLMTALYNMWIESLLDEA